MVIHREPSTGPRLPQQIMGGLFFCGASTHMNFGAAGRLYTRSLNCHVPAKFFASDEGGSYCRKEKYA